MTLTSQSQVRAPRLQKGVESSSSNSSNSNSNSNKKTHGCCSDYSVLMNLCGDVMLAMLVSMQGDLLEGDSNECLALLMHFSHGDRLTQIIDMVQKIRSGVPVVSSVPGESKRVGSAPHASSKDRTGGTSSSSTGAAVARPNWLAATGVMSTPTTATATAQPQLQLEEAAPPLSSADGHRIGSNSSAGHSRAILQRESLSENPEGAGKAGERRGQAGAEAR